MSLADQQWCPTSVQVTVLQARGLRIKGKSGTNDAYAVMQLGKEKYQTSVVEKSVAPVWKEEATFDLPQLQGGGGGGGGGGAERSTLHVHVLHRALVGPDKLLGQAVINLPQLSEDKSRNKTEWFKLLDKSGKPDKDRGEVLVDIQFMRNHMTASMFDLSAAGKSRSRLGKFKDKVRGKKKETDSVSSVVPSFTQVLTDSEEEEANGEGEASKDGKSKKHKMKSLFSPKSNLQRSMSQSMSVLPAKNSPLSGSQSSGLNVDASEGKKKFKFMIHKRSGSSDSKDSSSGHQKQVPVEQSNLCINGSHIYCEEPPPRTSRTGSSYSLASSGRGSMEDVPENSPPSADSLKVARQYSPWMEEEEEDVEEKAETTQENMDESKREEEERIRMEEVERKRMQEKEETVRRQKELESLTAEKLRQEERKKLEEEEKRKREEEERIRRENEKRRREEEEREEQRRHEQKLAEERKLKEEEERIRRENEKRRREEEEREEQRRQEEQKLAEERKMKEEEERIRRENEKRRQEEEEREEQRRQEEQKLAEERKMKDEEERRIEEEKARREEEQKREEERRQKEAEEEMARKLEAELKRRREEEERLKQEEEERERKEREEYERLLEEKRKLEEQKRIEAEEKLRKEEEEKMRMEEMKKKEEERRARREEKRRQEEEERKKAEQEEMQREEEERIRKEKLKQEELEKLAEEERRKVEEEKAKREEEERVRREEEIRREEQRRQQEEQERLVKQILRQKEEERKKLEEMVKREEEEQMRRKEEMRQREEEKARQEREAAERLAMETKRQQEEERRRVEEARKEEEERKRREEKAEEERKEKEAKKLEKEILTREVELCEKKESGTNDGGRAAGNKSKDSSPADITSANPFEEHFSSNPSVETSGSSSGPHSHKAKEETVPERCQSSVSVVESKAISAGEKDPVATQREKRPAPQPPGKNQSESQRQSQQDVSEIKQTKDKTVKTVSVLPQRSVQIITPLSKSPTDSENIQSVTHNSGTKVTSARQNKRPAPTRPSVEEPSTLSCKDVLETKRSTYGLNPFEDDEDENEPAAQDDAAVSVPVQWPPVRSQNVDKDAPSQVKGKSSKMARAPPPPAKNDATSSTLINQSHDGGHMSAPASATGPNGARDPQPEAGSGVNVQESPNQEPQQTKVKNMVAGVKEVGPPGSRRLQPVKPLTPPEQQSASVVQVETGKSTGILRGDQNKTKADGGLAGPYSQLTREELISLLLKQESQLSDREKKISELEQYIDNLLVRVMEEQPSILMSLCSVKKAI